MIERANQRITPNLPVMWVRYEMVKSVVTTRETKPLRTPMPAVAVLLVIPPPSRRGERISSIKFRDLDRQLEDEVPEYNPKARFQLTLALMHRTRRRKSKVKRPVRTFITSRCPQSRMITP